MFMIFLSLFSSIISPLLLYSFTCIPNILNSISDLHFLCILSFTFYHGIRASPVSLFTQSREQPDPQQCRAYTVNESIGRKILHKAWREIRSLPSTQKIVTEITHEEAECNTLKILRSQRCRRKKHLKNSKKFFQNRERLLQKAETSKDLVKIPSN